MEDKRPHLYFSVDDLSKMKPELSFRNVKTVGFIRENRICGIANSDGKLTMSESSIDTVFEHVVQRKYQHHRPYLVFAVISIVDGRPLLTPKYIKEITVDPWKYHIACTEVVTLFPISGVKRS